MQLVPSRRSRAQGSDGGRTCAPRRLRPGASDRPARRKRGRWPSSSSRKGFLVEVSPAHLWRCDERPGRGMYLARVVAQAHGSGAVASLGELSRSRTGRPHPPLGAGTSRTPPVAAYRRPGLCPIESAHGKIDPRGFVRFLVWTTPMSKLAARFGVSDVALAKTCAKFDVPRPALGYWQQLAAGMKPRRPRLPVSEVRGSVVLDWGSPRPISPCSERTWRADRAARRGPVA